MVSRKESWPVALDGLQYLVRVESSGGKRREEASMFAAFCKVPHHLLTQGF